MGWGKEIGIQASLLIDTKTRRNSPICPMLNLGEQRTERNTCWNWWILWISDSCHGWCKDLPPSLWWELLSVWVSDDNWRSEDLRFTAVVNMLYKGLRYLHTWGLSHFNITITLPFHWAHSWAWRFGCYGRCTWVWAWPKNVKLEFLLLPWSKGPHKDSGSLGLKAKPLLTRRVLAFPPLLAMGQLSYMHWMWVGSTLGAWSPRSMCRTT